MDGISRNTNKKKCSKWSHQNNFAHFLVSTRPNFLLFSNKRKTVKIGQNAFTLNQGDTPLEKIDKYKPLKDEIARLWEMQKVTIIPIVVGALGAITNRFGKFMQEIGIDIRIEHVQKTALLGTARLLRLVLGS